MSKLGKKLSLVFLIFVFVFSMILPTSYAKTKNHKYYVVKSAYLYNSKSAKKRRIKKLVLNTLITTQSKTTVKMYKIKYQGKSGYVYKSQVSKKPKKIARYVVKKSYLYNSTTKRKHRIATIGVNTKVVTTSSLSSKMYKIAYKKKKGYIKKSNLGLKKIKVHKTAESTSQSSSIAGTQSTTENNQNEKVNNNSGSNVSSSTGNNQTSNNSGGSASSNAGNNQNGTTPGTTTPSETAPSLYNKDYGSSMITRYQISQIPSQQKDSQFKVPNFDKNDISNIPSAKDTNSVDPVDLDVWDSWPLQNTDGTVAEYQGYHLVFALAGSPKNGNDTSIYLFYQKVGDTSIDSWKNAGRVFKDSDKNVLGDSILKYQTQEWSGSAVLTKDGKIRLFYTDFSGAPEDGGTGYGKQTLTTAQVDLSNVNSDALKVDNVEDYRSIFDGGDGTFYQNNQQFIDEGAYSSGDNSTLRDPHYVEDDGKKYLVFEANTGLDTGYQGENSLYNKAYYGGDDQFFNTDFKNLLSSRKKGLAELANGALGIIELNDNYTLKKVMKPLITANLVTDEIERANVFKLNGKWYLFTDTRGEKLALDNISSDMIYMLGYVSNNLAGPYKPLNNSGLVLASNESAYSRTFTYSYFNILSSDPTSKNVVVTSYMTNRGLFANAHSTFAPNFLLTIDGDKTYVRQNTILDQGQLTTDQNPGLNNQVDEQPDPNSNPDPNPSSY